MQRLILAILALPFILVASHAAQAQSRIGVREFVVEGPGAPPGLGRALAQALVVQLELLLRDEPEFETCEATASLTGADEPGDLASGSPTHLVDGRIEAAGADSGYEVSARSLGGPLAASSGRFDIANPSGFSAREIAAAILKAVCDQPEAAAKASRIKIEFNDLAIDQIVCNIHQPYKLSGLGATANIHYMMVPSDKKGGTWTLAGTAAYGVWKGAGTYSYPQLEDGFGVIELTGSWSVTVAGHTAATTDTIMGTIMPDDDPCRQMY